MHWTLVRVILKTWNHWLGKLLLTKWLYRLYIPIIVYDELATPHNIGDGSSLQIQLLLITVLVIQSP